MREVTELERRLIARIEREGPVAFRDFMQAALYDSELGYYNTARLKIGREGDYYTSSNVHPAFGGVLAQVLAGLWQKLAANDSHQPLTIIETGAGTGRLAADILTVLRDEQPQAFQKVKYLIIESSPAMRNRQHEYLAGFQGRVEWRELEELRSEPVIGLAFSNEFIDALPVHRVRFINGQFQEQFVSLEQRTKPAGKRLTLHWGRPTTEKIADYIKRLNVRLFEGQVLEVNLDAIEWLEQMAKAINRGYLITVDYGDLSSHLYGYDRREGTLRSFYRHRLVDSPLERVGEQDITASVNFSALMDYGRDLGFETLSYERQTAFLMRNGLVERIMKLSGATETVDNLNERLAIKNLFVPGGVSDNFRVLIQRIRNTL